MIMGFAIMVGLNVFGITAPQYFNLPEEVERTPAYGLNDNVPRGPSELTHLTKTQTRLTFPSPLTGEPLAVVMEWGVEMPPQLIGCYAENIDDFDTYSCMFLGSMVYNKDGSILGNRLFTKKFKDFR